MKTLHLFFLLSQPILPLNVINSNTVVLLGIIPKQNHVNSLKQNLP